MFDLTGEYLEQPLEDVLIGHSGEVNPDLFSKQRCLCHHMDETQQDEDLDMERAHFFRILTEKLNFSTVRTMSCPHGNQGRVNHIFASPYYKHFVYLSCSGHVWIGQRRNFDVSFGELGGEPERSYRDEASSYIGKDEDIHNNRVEDALEDVPEGEYDPKEYAEKLEENVDQTERPIWDVCYQIEESGVDYTLPFYNPKEEHVIPDDTVETRKFEHDLTQRKQLGMPGGW